jgi:starch phosphorylase
MSSQPSIPTLPYPDHRLPPALAGLSRLAYNMYWSWHPEVRALFARIDRATWSEYRSPVAVLRASRDWTSVLDDPDFMVQYQTVLDAFDSYMTSTLMVMAPSQPAILQSLLRHA